MRTTTIGVFETRIKNETIINELKAGGISDNEISCIYLDKDGDMRDEQTDEKVEDGAVKGATTGAVVGAIAGLAVANGILPGLGTIFVAGPLLMTTFGLTAAAATTVGGALTGTLAGGVIGALAQLGISETDAEIYMQNLEKGNVVFVTRTDKSTAKDVLAKNGAMEVREYIEQ